MKKATKKAAVKKNTTYADKPMKWLVELIKSKKSATKEAIRAKLVAEGYGKVTVAAQVSRLKNSGDLKLSNDGLSYTYVGK